MAFPTEARLYTKILLRLINLAKRRDLVLRQTYIRKAPGILRQQGRGDRINALLAGIGANLRKLLAAFWRALWYCPTNYARHLLLAILPRHPQPAVAA